jgi:hypothetical protein
MKSFAALGAVGLIAAVGMLWFLSNPVVFTVKVKPLQPSSALPTFKPVSVPMSSPH